MRGFSLLETILYIALFSLMFTGFMTSALFLHDALVRSGHIASDLLDSLNARDAADIGVHSF